MIQQLIYNPALGKPGLVPNGDGTLSWSYVEDMARATVLACKAPRTKTRVFSTMGDVRTVKEVADYVRRLLPDADLTLQPGVTMFESFKYDTKAIEEELGYRPQWSIERGIKETINIVRREHGLTPV